VSYRTLSAAGLLFALGAFGCSNARPTLEMTEVSGRVTINGRPVAKMIMNLTPVTPGEGREDGCVVEAGEFRHKVISARYKVSFTQAPGGPGVPTRYRTPDTSPLLLDGTRSEPVSFDLN
jgi:hypothetical protein